VVALAVARDLGVHGHHEGAEARLARLGHELGGPVTTPEVVQLEPEGTAAAAVTSAIECPDMELNVKMVPAAPAAAAPAASPLGCIIRVKPTGLTSSGIETGVPKTVVVRSGAGCRR